MKSPKARSGSLWYLREFNFYSYLPVSPKKVSLDFLQYQSLMMTTHLCRHTTPPLDSRRAYMFQCEYSAWPSTLLTGPFSHEESLALLPRPFPARLVAKAQRSFPASSVPLPLCLLPLGEALEFCCPPEATGVLSASSAERVHFSKAWSPV